MAEVLWSQTAIMALKAATDEYEEAIVKGRIAKPVEYQDSRGFVWQAERMIDSVGQRAWAQGRGRAQVGASRLAQLKKIWPAPMPPQDAGQERGRRG